MSREIYPRYSKSAVNRAGEAVRRNCLTVDHLAVIENWRASHTHILNTFQANLRRRVKGTNIVFAQRLKRKTTIFDKLQRENGMSLARMHDIAGCRLIFEDIRALTKFRKEFHRARFNHKLKHTDIDAYNYIKSPKSTGYRGIHDVYEYVGIQTAVKWNGLSIEIQYRTKYQHAWATAVEIAGTVTENQPKFNRGDERHKEFFRLASEIIARVFEGSTSCYPTISNLELLKRFRALESEIHLLRTLQGLNAVNTHITQGKNVILIFSESNKSLQAFTYDDPTLALEQYFKFEKDSLIGEDIVLVRADNKESIRNAFRNYFSDAKDFTAYMKTGLRKLETGS